MNQINGVSVQRKGGDLCTVIQDGHYFNVLININDWANDMFIIVENEI